MFGRYLQKTNRFRHAISPHSILGDPGADSGGKGKTKRAEKNGAKKSKERGEPSR